MLKKLTTIAALALMMISLFSATPLKADNYEEYWQGSGDPWTYMGFLEMGEINAFHEWWIKIYEAQLNGGGNISGRWEDQYGHNGDIRGYIDYTGNGAGSGTWDCDQHGTTGTWVGTFDGDIGDSCSGTYKYYYGGQLKNGGWFKGVRTF